MVDKIIFTPYAERDKFKFNGYRGDDDVADETVVIREQNLLLPIANVGRIMKKILPPNAKISKEAKVTMQECVSEFIGFITGEASEKWKTIKGDDICWAFSSLGFDNLVQPLMRYLARYGEVEGERSANMNKSNAEPVCLG